MILGIDFGGTKVAIGIADGHGAVTGQRRLATEAAFGADQAVARALEAASELLAGSPLTAVGVVSPGIVLPDRVLLAPNVPGWDQLHLREVVEERFQVPVAVGTDAKAAALAEARWGALRDADPGIFLTVGTGIAAAIVIGGKVLTGAHGAAGEIGYHLRGVADVGGAASLERAVAGRGLGERATELLGRPTTAADLFRSTDPAAVRLRTEALDEMAVHVANLATTIDPAVIAVGGGMTASADELLASIQHRLTQAVPFPPRLVRAKFDQDGALRGAIALAVDQVQEQNTAVR